MPGHRKRREREATGESPEEGQKRPAPPDHSHARARAESVLELLPATMPETVEERVQLIADLMLEDLWHPSLGPYVAAAWGIARETLARYAAEAHRLVVRALGTPDEVEARMRAKLENLIERSMAMGFPSAAVKACDVILGTRRAEREVARLGKENDTLRTENAQLKHRLTTLEAQLVDMPPGFANAMQDPLARKLFLRQGEIPTDAELEAERSKSGDPDPSTH